MAVLVGRTEAQGPIWVRSAAGRGPRRQEREALGTESSSKERSCLVPGSGRFFFQDSPIAVGVLVVLAG